MGPLRAAGEAWKGGLQGRTSPYPLSSAPPPPPGVVGNLLLEDFWCLCQAISCEQTGYETTALATLMNNGQSRACQFMFINRDWIFHIRFYYHVRQWEIGEGGVCCTYTYRKNKDKMVGSSRNRYLHLICKVGLNEAVIKGPFIARNP